MKKFLVVTATADERMPESQKTFKTNPITGIYTETTMLNSDYAKILPSGLYETTTQTEEMQNFPPPQEPVLWVTTITRIA